MDDKNIGPEPAKASIKDVMEATVCIVVGFNRLGNSAAVGQDQYTVKADKKMTSLKKRLLDSTELRNISGHDVATAIRLDALAIPMAQETALFRGGVRLFAVEDLLDAVRYLERRKVERDALIEVFVAAYPRLVTESQSSLGDLFNPGQYPSVATLRDAFGMSWRVIEWGTPDKKLKSISAALFEKESAKAEAEWTDVTRTIGDALVLGMSEIVGHFTDKVSGDGKRISAKGVEKVTAFLDAFNKRNVVKRQDLTDLVEQAKKMLTGVDAKQLRDDDALRGRVATQFTAFKASLDEMAERAPRRRVSISEEVL